MPDMNMKLTGPKDEVGLATPANKEEAAALYRRRTRAYNARPGASTYQEMRDAWAYVRKFAKPKGL